jgi:phosphotriesterase-related protein
MEILKSENVEMSSFIWVHAHNGSLEGNLKAAALGAWISLDNYNTRRDMKADTRFNTSWYVKRLQELKDAGELGKVLISHDAGWYRPGEPNGGEIRGYTEIFTSLIPALQEGGFTKDDIEQLLVKNPLNAFVIKK